jgi:hypothetical protein
MVRQFGTRRSLLYDVQWQRLRVSFQDSYREDGGWKTLTGTQANIVSLRNYATEQPLGEERSVRLYRVHNLLNSVRLTNSGRGAKDSKEDLAVLAFRDGLPGFASPHITSASNRWDWKIVEKALLALLEAEPVWFGRIREDITTRLQLYARYNGKPHNTRSEMDTFLRMMTAVSARTPQ